MTKATKRGRPRAAPDVAPPGREIKRSVYFDPRRGSSGRWIGVAKAGDVVIMETGRTEELARRAIGMRPRKGTTR